MLDINFSKAEKYSYAYVNDTYAKIAVAAAGSAVLADPMAWSYAETHSYVKIDPSTLNVAVPSSVTDIYAKVIYLGNSSTISSGDVNQSQITVINSKLTQLSSAIPLSTSQLINNSEFIQSSEIIQLIPTKVSELENDKGFALSSSIPLSASQLVNDIHYALKSELPTGQIISVEKLPFYINGKSFGQIYYVIPSNKYYIPLERTIFSLTTEFYFGISNEFIGTSWITTDLYNNDYPILSAELSGTNYYIAYNTTWNIYSDLQFENLVLSTEMIPNNDRMFSYSSMNLDESNYPLGELRDYNSIESYIIDSVNNHESNKSLHINTWYNATDDFSESEKGLIYIYKNGDPEENDPFKKNRAYILDDTGTQQLLVTSAELSSAIAELTEKIAVLSALTTNQIDLGNRNSTGNDLIMGSR